MKTQVATIAFTFLATIAGANDSFWLISEAQAKCIIENREAYLNQAGDLILIPVDQCPNTDIFAGALDGQQNFGGISDLQTSDSGNSLDQLITYTPEQLRCLESEMVELEADVALLPKFVKCAE